MVAVVRSLGSLMSVTVGAPTVAWEALPAPMREASGAARAISAAVVRFTPKSMAALATGRTR